MDKQAIEAVRTALGELNRALAALPALGISIEFDHIESQAISERAPRVVVTAHLSRIKTEIDVRL